VSHYNLRSKITVLNNRHSLDPYKRMTTSSDFNMLRLKAPQDLLQITDAKPASEQAVEMSNPAIWVWTMVRQQREAESDLRQLTELCSNTIDRTDQQMQRIEQAYYTLAEDTRYVCDQVNANEEIAEAWVRTELASAANVYETVTNLARQARWRRHRCHSHPCHPAARPRFRCHSRSHPPCLCASTDLRHIAPVAISQTAGRSRPLSFVSSMLLARPSPVRYVCCLPLIKLARPSPMFVSSIVFP